MKIIALVISAVVASFLSAGTAGAEAAAPAFRPGEVWLDTAGRPINAHGGGMMFHGGKYFLIASGCTGWNPNPARSAVADSIWGPWTELGNPCRGPESEITYRGQSTFVFPIAGKPGPLVFMADRWNKSDLKDSRYLWLPLRIVDGKPVVEWADRWDLSAFDRAPWLLMMQ